MQTEKSTLGDQGQKIGDVNYVPTYIIAGSIAAPATP